MQKEKFDIGKVEVLMGWRCNCSCVFCSVGHKLKDDRRIKSWKDIKKDIDYAMEKNVKVVSLSGGEPTIVPYFFRALEYAKSKGFETIEVQSNGRLFSYWDFAKRTVESGANRFLVSLHANNPEMGDFLMRCKGAFRQTVKGLRNLEKLGIKNLRFSTVATAFNYRDFPEIIKFLLGFDAVGYHMGFVMVDGYAYMNDRAVIPTMTEVAPKMLEASDIVLNAGKEAWIYSIPYCLLQGHENVVAEMGRSDTILRGPEFNTSIQRNRRKFREKRKSCNGCKYEPICLGVWRRYVKLKGFNEFKPVPGEKITETSQFATQGYRK